MRAKTKRAFRTISEAGDELGLQPHVLRFWESKFSEISPIKRGGGRRFYRPEDIELLRGIKTLLHDERHPIKDVQKLIAKSGVNRVIDLGRSVQEASRERDLADLDLVPERIEKPEVIAVEAAVPVPPPNPKTVMETATPLPAPVIETVVVPEAQPVATAQPKAEPKPKDMSAIVGALGRLQALKGQWDSFDSAPKPD